MVSISREEELNGLMTSLPEELYKDLLIARDRMHVSSQRILEYALRSFLRDLTGKRTVYLSAPANALLKGVYEENTSIGELKGHGDFGLGTFNSLDGEMIMLDGIVYQLRADGHTAVIKDSVQTPFACVTFFNPTSTERIEESMEYPAFKNLLYRLAPSGNIFYAVRIDGEFSAVKVWTVAKQEPNRSISEVAAERFEYNDVTGTIVGFYTPEFLKPLSMPGYHLHFLTEDRMHGGHLHQCRMKSGTVAVQFVFQVELNLPVTLDYLTANLQGA